MPLFRRRDSGSDDPRGRGREADDAIGQALGLAPAAVTDITSILRGPVCDHIVRELPRVEHSTAPRPLLLVCAAATQLPVDVVRTIRPDASYGHAAAAALPGMMLFAITMELTRRYDVAYPDLPFEQYQDPAPPVPPDELRARYDALRQDPRGGAGDGLLGQVAAPERERYLTTAAGLGQGMAQAVTAGVDALPSLVWGAWALVAAIGALHAQQHRLPEPGQPRNTPRSAGAEAAGFAYWVGRTALASTAVSLVDSAESSLR